MADVNSLTATGNLVADPQTTKTADGYEFVEAKIAVNGIKQGDVLWLGLAAFGKTGETLMKYGHKGKKIGVTGAIKLKTWDKRDGGTGAQVSMSVSSLTLMGSKKDSVEQPASPAPTIPSPCPGDYDTESDDSDIPF